MYSLQIKKAVQQIITWYADTRGGLALLDVNNIPENDLNNLCSLILSQNDDLAAEAAGPDNPEWERTMMPALVNTLRSTYGTPTELNDIWTAGIRAYLMPVIQRLLEDELLIINEDTECHMSLIWDRVSERTVEVRQSHG